MNWFRRRPATTIEITDTVGEATIHLKVQSPDPAAAVDAFRQGLSLAHQLAKAPVVNNFHYPRP